MVLAKYFFLDIGMCSFLEKALTNPKTSSDFLFYFGKWTENVSAHQATK